MVLPLKQENLTTKFESTGTTNKNITGDEFIDQIPTMINLLSTGNEYISNFLSTQLINGNNLQEPSFFQLPFISSIIQNVNNNNYTFSSSTNGNLVTAIYNIPYKGLLEERIATFITFYDKERKLLNYEIPRDLSYNSKEQAIVNVIINSNIFYLWIPFSFFETDVKDIYFVLDFNISKINTTLNLEVNRPIPTGVTYSYLGTRQVIKAV